ncbi:MAG: GDP-L-fucose synthase [Mariniphaga sp.]
MQHSDKIYIAGHKGLVGSALWENLLSKGYTNLIGRTKEELNLLEVQAVNTFFETEKPAYVILAAAKVGGIVANNTYRGEFIYENLMIQNNVIHASYLNNVKKLLFLGSTCIYPRNAPQPMPEDCLLTSPLEYTNEPYAIAKIAGVKICESYNLQYNTNFIAVMPTNLYGPNDNFDLEKSHVLPGLLRKIYLGKCLEEGDWNAIRSDLKKRPIEGINGERNTRESGGRGKMNSEDNKQEVIDVLEKFGIKTFSAHPLIAPTTKSVSVEIWGSGKPMREFLWSEEMADACVYLMETINFEDLISINLSIQTDSGQSTSTEVRNTHINIGTGKEISIRDLAYLIKGKLNFKGELIFNTSKPDGTMRKLTDPSKLHNLGWHHQIEIEEGVERLYKWYIEN